MLCQAGCPLFSGVLLLKLDNLEDVGGDSKADWAKLGILVVDDCRCVYNSLRFLSVLAAPPGNAAIALGNIRVFPLAGRSGPH